MPVRLVGIAGPLEGAVFLSADRQVILALDDYHVPFVTDDRTAARHCVIDEAEGRWRVSEGDPQNPPIVNGLPVTDHALADGDRLKLGDSLFLVEVHASRPQGVATGTIEEPKARVRITRELRREDVLQLQPAHLDAEIRSGSWRPGDLSTLLKISVALSAIHGFVELERPLLELLFEAIPADLGGIVMGDGDRESSIPVNHAVVHHVVHDVVAVCATEAPEDAGQPERQLLVAPVAVFDRVLGAIYLTASGPDVRFDEAHLQLLTAVAGLAAVALAHAQEIEALEVERRRLRAEIHIEHNIVGNGPAMRDIYRQIGRVAPTDSTVLIRGESGTGKELVARAIHLNSGRADRPFLPINCAAIAEHLLESELFGYEKGAFTGAVARKPGKLELAQGGTIFFDEIGELPPTLQVKLLRVLQEREFERVGGVKSIHVDFRVLAATNMALEDALEKGAFRRDLYYRLNVVSLTLPPLRDRKDDILSLSHHFARKHGARTRKRIGGITDEALEALRSYDWPGNVRELENAIERAVVLGSGERILAEDLPETVLDAAGRAPSDGLAPANYHQYLRQAKRDLIVQALARAGGNYTSAARQLGVHPNYLHRLIRNLDLKSTLQS